MLTNSLFIVQDIHLHEYLAFESVIDKLRRISSS